MINKGIFRGFLFLLVVVTMLLPFGRQVFAQEKPKVFVQLGHSDVVTSVAFSPDGRTLASASSDGTSRIWDVNTGKEIAQFVGFKDGEWIVITPEGYYNASPNGDRHLNVRIGNNVYGIENYREAFYRPDLVKITLSGFVTR